MNVRHHKYTWGPQGHSRDARTPLKQGKALIRARLMKAMPAGEWSKWKGSQYVQPTVR